MGLCLSKSSVGNAVRSSAKLVQKKTALVFADYHYESFYLEINICMRDMAYLYLQDAPIPTD